jgi:hypothetical protein
MSGNSRNVALYGGVGYTAGLFGQALDLHDNGTQYAQRPGDDAAYDLESKGFTVQAWVNFYTISGSREQTIVEKFTGGGGPGWTITVPAINGSNEIEFYSQPTLQIDSAPLTISAGAWHQVLVRRSGPHFDLFFDDVVVASGVASGALPTSTNPLLIGRRDAQDLRDFAVDGRVDEVAIWDRALTSKEIANLWNNGAGQPVIGGSKSGRSLDDTSGKGVLDGGEPRLQNWTIIPDKNAALAYHPVLSSATPPTRLATAVLFSQTAVRDVQESLYQRSLHRDTDQPGLESAIGASQIGAVMADSVLLDKYFAGL